MLKKMTFGIFLIVAMNVLHGADSDLHRFGNASSSMELEKNNDTEKVLLPKIEDYFLCGYVPYQSQEKDQLFWRYEPDTQSIIFKKLVGHSALIKKLQKISNQSQKDDLPDLIEQAKGAYVRSCDDETYIARLRELRQMNIRIVEEIAQLDDSGFANTRDDERHPSLVVPNSAFGFFKSIYTYPPDKNPMDAERFCVLIEKLMEQGPDYNKGTFLIALHDQMLQFYEDVKVACDAEATGWQLIKQRSKTYYATSHNKHNKKAKSKGKEKE